MATWTLYLMRTPLNTFTGTGVITPLTLASGVTMSYKVDDIDTLSFSVPGRHYQTGLIQAALTDVIAFRDEEPMQRFRVVSTSIQGAGTNVTVNVTCSAYREVINSWIFQDATLIGEAVLTTDLDGTVATITPDPGLSVGDPVTFGYYTGENPFWPGLTGYVYDIISPGSYHMSTSLKSEPPNLATDGTTRAYSPTDRLDFFQTDHGVGHSYGAPAGGGGFIPEAEVTFDIPHDMVVGDYVHTWEDGTGDDLWLYVKTVPTSTTATFSTTLGGADYLWPVGFLQFFYSYQEDNDPSVIAWLVVDEGQSKPYGDINCSQGVVPATPLQRRAFYPDSEVQGVDAQAHYFAPGQTRTEGINQLAQIDDNGFDWSIDPDPADPFLALKFNTWNRGERTQFPGTLSDFVLSEASMASWSVTNDLADYANILRVTPNADTLDGTVGGFDPAVWRPADFTPTNTDSDPEAEQRGRWEMSLPSEQFNPELVAKYADEQLKVHQDRSIQLQCSLMAGRWRGKDDFWLGDSMRLLLRVPLVDEDNLPTGDFLLDFDGVVRAVGITINVGTDGSEQVSLELNRPLKTLLNDIYTLQGDVRTLKRR